MYRLALQYVIRNLATKWLERILEEKMVNCKDLYNDQVKISICYNFNIFQYAEATVTNAWCHFSLY